MDTSVPDGPNARFKVREVVTSAFVDESTADIAANSADVALVIDHKGVVRDAAFAGEDFTDGEFDHWVGKKWSDLVTVDSVGKVGQLLQAAHDGTARRWRHVNHHQGDGPDLPIRYFAMPSGKPGWTLALGRDLRAAARIQQRLVEAQRSMERDYARVREAETRFRLLFQLASEGVLVIEGSNQRVTDVNPAAAQWLGKTAQRLEGRSLDQVFGAKAADRVRETLAVARKTGRPEQIELALEGAGQPAQMQISVFRQGRDVYFLARLMIMDAASEAGETSSELADILPDGLVVVGENGRIQSANEAFVELAQLSDVQTAIGTGLDRYLGRTETELNVLLANVREHGVIRNYATSVRSPQDLLEAVEVSAVAAPGLGGGRVFAFSIRPVGRRLVAGRRAEGGPLPASVDQLSDLVGRVALKEIVRESTDMIERSCIEAALTLTNDNRASAAEILGLSRQSLYAKMHRHKIGELQSRDED